MRGRGREAPFIVARPEPFDAACRRRSGLGTSGHWVLLMIGVETDVSEDWDSRVDWEQLARRSVHAAMAVSPYAGLSDSEISVLFAADEDVRELNRAWRGKDKATNVLSFPMAAPDELAEAPMLGDVVLAHGVCEREAGEKKVSIEAHAAHLVVHGTLHLLGYDHEQGEDAAEEMEDLERQALAAIGVADPYELNEVRS
jgi:probable rRNA maturation factor